MDTTKPKPYMHTLPTLTHSLSLLSIPCQPITHVMARNLAAKICQPVDTKPLLLALALKEPSPSLLKSLQELVVQYQVW